MTSDTQEKLPLSRESLDSEAADELSHLRKMRSETRRTFCWDAWVLLCLLSLFINLLFVTLYLWPSKYNAHAPDISRYAGLSRTSSLTFEPYSVYGVGNSNETDRSIMWESLDVSAGEVALDLQWARELGLPEAQSFPWDRSKGIYLLNGHHSLHCLRKVRRWVTIAHHNGTQLDAYSHVVHCLSLLLQNIMCEADDTPIYTTAGLRKDAGDGQSRQCRSWEALNEWAESHTACYGFINETQGVNTTFERFKYCPEGSPFAPKMRERLGLPPDWHQARPSEMNSLPAYWKEFQNNELGFHELIDI